jgi:hypothetical protein
VFSSLFNPPQDEGESDFAPVLYPQFLTFEWVENSMSNSCKGAVGIEKMLGGGAGALGMRDEG